MPQVCTPCEARQSGTEIGPVQTVDCVVEGDVSEADVTKWMASVRNLSGGSTGQ
jgi:hypothetical protein